MRSILAGLRNLVLPWGATSGQRIILNADTGKIQVYDSSGTEVARIDATGVLTGTDLSDTTNNGWSALKPGAGSPPYVAVGVPSITTAGGMFLYVGQVAESWHYATLQNGWTNRGIGFPNAQYRRAAAPANAVQLVGQILPGTKTDGTVLFNLPAGYRPNVAEIALPAVNGVTLAIEGNGDVAVYGFGTNSILQFNTIIPCDTT